MSAPLPPVRRKWFDAVAMVAIGVLVVGAGLLPAATANSGETVTIRGDVSVGGQPLDFFPVGFWAPGQTDPPTTRTDANGRFTLDVPAGLDGFAFAGTAPDSDHAIVDAGGTQVVRGVIGSKAATPVSTPLYQGWTAATGKRLAQDAAQLHFLLQRPGRIAGTSPVAASSLTALQIRRFDDSVVQSLRLDSRGRFQSSPLVPGTYGVTLVPKAPALPVVATAQVRSGAITTVRLGAPVRGAELSGVVRADDAVAGSGVPVLLLDQDGRLVAHTATTAGGGYRLTGLAAGDYTISVGRYDPPAEPTPSQTIPIPGRTSTPTPALTATPTPTPSPTSPASAALVPVDRTSDAVLPASVEVEIPATLVDVSTDVVAEAAGHVSGTVEGGDGSPVQVVVEDAVTGQVLRSTTASATGDYRFGGLVQGGQYEVWAVTRPKDPGTARMGSASALATASTTKVDVDLDSPALSLAGTVDGAAAGSVSAGSKNLLLRAGSIGRDGSYVVRGLVPGAYPVTVATPLRLDSAAVSAVLSRESARLDLRPGPKAAVFKGWFISGGAGVPVVQGSATAADGAKVRFGPATNGHVEVGGLEPGLYAYDVDGFQGTVPAVDGPWFFLPPTGTFSLSDGATTDVDAIVLHVRAR